MVHLRRHGGNRLRGAARGSPGNSFNNFPLGISAVKTFTKLLPGVSHSFAEGVSALLISSLRASIKDHDRSG